MALLDRDHALLVEAALPVPDEEFAVYGIDVPQSAAIRSWAPPQQAAGRPPRPCARPAVAAGSLVAGSSALVLIAATE